MNSKVRGFTLVELLAIIVILGVIAVIVVPKIVKTVDDARLAAAGVSAKGFSDAISKFYMENNKTSYQDMINENYGVKITGSYVVLDGHIKKGSDDYLIPVNGTTPTSGILEINTGVVMSGCLTVGKYSTIIDNSNVVDTFKGTCSDAYSEEIDSIEGDVALDGYKYFDEPIVVYYDPVNGKTCSSSDGCMKWYAYSVKDGIVNLLLDHNIGSSSWINELDYVNYSTLGSSLGVSNMNPIEDEYGGVNSWRGPLTALSSLKSLTSSWSTSVLGDFSTYTANGGNSIYSIDYSNYSSRFITAQEVAYISDADWNESSNSYTIKNIPIFLSDNLSYGERYWTSSPITGYYYQAWSVDSGPNVNSGGALISSSFNSGGIRPVISLYFGVIKDFVQ